MLEGLLWSVVVLELASVARCGAPLKESDYGASCFSRGILTVARALHAHCKLRAIDENKQYRSYLYAFRAKRKQKNALKSGERTPLPYPVHS